MIYNSALCQPDFVICYNCLQMTNFTFQHHSHQEKNQ